MPQLLAWIYAPEHAARFAGKRGLMARGWRYVYADGDAPWECSPAGLYEAGSYTLESWPGGSRSRTQSIRPAHAPLDAPEGPDPSPTPFESHQPLPPGAAPVLRWRDTDGDVWEITAKFSSIGDRVECTGVRIDWSPVAPREPSQRPLAWWEPDNPPLKPLSATVLREVPWGALIDRARAAIPELTTRTTGSFDVQPRRRKQITRDFLEEVAAVYTAARSSNIAAERRKPTLAVARHFNVPKNTAARYVMRCRRQKPPLLPPTGKGRAAH